MIEAKIVKDSISTSGVRLTTFVLTYPRFIHAEFMTHRVFSRNASSSRAIPVKKSIQMVNDNPEVPLAFTKNKAGMQGGEALDGEAHQRAIDTWNHAKAYAVEFAKQLEALEVHKQYANRLLEPFSHITVIVTSTDWTNFFALRNHEAAQPEIHMLADQMYGQYFLNKPEKCYPGDWHLPFIEDEDVCEAWDLIHLKTINPSVPEQYVKELLIKRSVARCARVSYNNHDGTKTTFEQDSTLYDRLVGSAPIHASPAEHQAMAVGDPNMRSGNFRGWDQFRKSLSSENIREYELLEE